jgi:SOS-response transcriptional repressor LexA
MSDIELHVEKVKRFYWTHRRLPSYSEIMTLCGFASKNAAFRLVGKLIDQGVVAKDRAGKLVPLRVASSIKVLGLVEAGFAAPAEEELLDTMSLDEYLVANKEATYSLRVKGDSMEGAGIREGDMVLVERGRTAKPGDIVIACVDGGYTMKYYELERGKPVLVPANPKYPIIRPQEALQIDAIVTAVIRKYDR